MFLLSSRLKELRISQSLKQIDVAVGVGISERAYRYYEYGQRQIPFDVLVKLSEFYGNVSLDYLAGRTDNPDINR
jgi:transcriptional regulator with XRE-family HTH domain